MVLFGVVGIVVHVSGPEESSHISFECMKVIRLIDTNGIHPQVFTPVDGRHASQAFVNILRHQQSLTIAD
jgi:hypothetical protein